MTPGTSTHSLPWRERLGPFGVRPFVAICAGGALSRVGSSAAHAALIWLVQARTASPKTLTFAGVEGDPDTAASMAIRKAGPVSLRLPELTSDQRKALREWKFGPAP